MADIEAARREMIARILRGPGQASLEQRGAAFDNRVGSEPVSHFVDAVARHPARVTENDVAAVIGAGLTEDQVFEIVVCAAVGEATRQHESALAALTAARSEDADAARSSG